MCLFIHIYVYLYVLRINWGLKWNEMNEPFLLQPVWMHFKVLLRALSFCFVISNVMESLCHICPFSNQCWWIFAKKIVVIMKMSTGTCHIPTPHPCRPLSVSATQNKLSWQSNWKEMEMQWENKSRRELWLLRCLQDSHQNFMWFIWTVHLISFSLPTGYLQFLLFSSLAVTH